MNTDPTDYAHPTEAELRGIDVHTLLPQQEPFVMVSTLAHFDETTTATETLVRPDNLFVDNGVLRTTGMIENIAQTCAARIGYYNKYILKAGVQIGVIGAVRKMKVSGHPHVGQQFWTTVTVVEELLGMTLANAEITCEGKTLATAQIKLAVKEQ